MTKKRVLALVILGFIIIFFVIGCAESRTFSYDDSDSSTWWYEGHTQVQAQQESYVKFQDRMSMDWDAEQSEMLMFNAIYHAGINADPETYAYNIVVTLNRMLSDEYPDTIEDNCFGEEYINENVKEGLRMVMIDRWDETYGSLKYIDEEK